MFKATTTFFGGIMLAMALLPTTTTTAQEVKSIQLVTTTPGYFGRTNVISYESGLSTNVFLISRGSLPGSVNATLMHTLSYERVFSRRSSFGAKLFLTGSYGAFDNFLIMMEGDERHESSIQEQINSGQIPSSTSVDKYEIFMTNSETSGIGLSTYIRWYKKTFAPEGWFFELQLGVMQHKTSGVTAAFTRGILPVPITMDPITRTTVLFSPGLGYSKGISKRLLFTVNTNFNLYAIFNSFSNQPTYSLGFFEDPIAADGSFDQELKRGMSRETALMGLVQLNLGLRFTL